MPGDYYFSNVSLLLHGNGADNGTVFTDSSLFGETPTVASGVTTSTAQSIFGGSSMFFDGVGGKLTYAASSKWDLGTTFSIGFWAYPTALPASGNTTRLCLIGVNATNSAATIQIYSNGSWGWAIPFSSTVSLTSPASNFALNEWNYYEVCVDKGVARLFKNGSIVAGPTAVSTQATSATNGLIIGFDTVATVNAKYTGYLSDFRITKGTARNVAAYTSPAGLLPDTWEALVGQEFVDRVADVTNSTGTGTIILSSFAPPGFRSFASSGHSSGAVIQYVISSANGLEWEVGTGTWNSASNSITRAAVHASSNSNALVNFSAGTKDVAEVLTAANMRRNTSLLDKCELTAAGGALNNSGWQKVPFDVVIHDTNNIWNPVTRRIVPKSPGFYSVNFGIRTTSPSAKLLSVYKNGSIEKVVGAETVSTSYSVGGSSLIYCNGTTDYLEPFIYSGDTRTLVATWFDSYFQVAGPV